MTRLCVLGLTLTLVVAGLAPTAAQAQVTQTIKLLYYGSSATSANPGTASTWSTGFYGLDYRIDAKLSPWGAHLQYITGTQSGGTGAAAGTSGTDTIYSIDATYRWQVQWQAQSATVHAFLGYGSITPNFNFAGAAQKFTSTGLRIGADVNVPIGINTPWSVNGAVAWYPSNSTQFSSAAVTSSASGSASDYSVSVQYTTPAPGLWLAEAGYRGVSFGTGTLAGTICAPCTHSWSGWFLAVGKIFP